MQLQELNLVQCAVGCPLPRLWLLAKYAPISAFPACCTGGLLTSITFPSQFISQALCQSDWQSLRTYVSVDGNVEAT